MNLLPQQKNPQQKNPQQKNPQENNHQLLSHNDSSLIDREWGGKTLFFYIFY
jgi:hypothetical protein